MSNVSPFNAAAAAVLSARATGATPLVPVTHAKHPELARLLQIQVANGAVPKEEYDKVSRELGRSKRQLQRDLAALRRDVGAPGRPARQRFELTVHHKQTIFACAGNVQLAWEELTKAGESVPPYKTFWRAWRELPVSVRKYARHGAKGLVDFWLYPPWEAPARNEVWQADHFELPVDVVADGHVTQLVKPWFTAFIDDRTRYIMSWSMTAEPGRRVGADSVRATIAAGIRIRLVDGVEVGGAPWIIRWDNDRSFTAGDLVLMGETVGFRCHAVPPYSGHMKGKIERFGRTIQEQLCALQPGYTHGPKTYRNRDPFRAEGNLTADELRSRISEWVDAYNRRVHSSLGCTPLESWTADTTPLRRVGEERLRTSLLKAERLHKINKRKGIHFKGQWWLGADMLDHVGAMAEIRYPIGDDIDFIEVYVNGKWLATAWPAVRLTQTQRSAIFERRDDLYAEARGLQDGATRMRQDAEAQNQTDATPSAAAMPAQDPLAADPNELLALLERGEGA